MANEGRTAISPSDLFEVREIFEGLSIPLTRLVFYYCVDADQWLAKDSDSMTTIAALDVNTGVWGEV